MKVVFPESCVDLAPEVYAALGLSTGGYVRIPGTDVTMLPSNASDVLASVIEAGVRGLMLRTPNPVYASDQAQPTGESAYVGPIGSEVGQAGVATMSIPQIRPGESGLPPVKVLPTENTIQQNTESTLATPTAKQAPKQPAAEEKPVDPAKAALSARMLARMGHSFGLRGGK